MLSSIIYAQNKTTHNLEYRESIAYEKGEDKPFTGEYVLKYSNGQTQMRLNYVNGMLDGVSSWWWLHGAKKELITYKNNLPNGKAVWWLENCEKQLQGEYKDGVLYSLTKYEDGKPISNDNIGKPYSGDFIVMYSDDQKYLQVRYKDGRKNGTEVFWDRNGEEMYEIKFVNGVAIK